LGSGGLGNFLAPNSPVDDRIVVAGHDVVNDGRILVDGFRRGRRHVITVRMSVGKPIQRKERVMAIADPKVETEADGTIPIIEPQPPHIASFRWQRRPAAVIARITPTHPRRSPTGVRHPKPPDARIRAPTSIMERRPAPGIIRIPVPTGVAPHPPTSIGVRTPVG